MNRECYNAEVRLTFTYHSVRDARLEASNARDYASQQKLQHDEHTYVSLHQLAYNDRHCLKSLKDAPAQTNQYNKFSLSTSHRISRDTPLLSVSNLRT